MLQRKQLQELFLCDGRRKGAFFLWQRSLNGGEVVGVRLKEDWEEGIMQDKHMTAQRLGRDGMKGRNGSRDEIRLVGDQIILLYRNGFDVLEAI